MSQTLRFILPVALLWATVGFSENSPAFRGPRGNGNYSSANVPVSWDEKSGENIAWTAALDLSGWASPIVLGDRVIAVGADANLRRIYCFNAATGVSVWSLTVPESPSASNAYKPDSSDRKWDVQLYAAATPATDGNQVYALFSNGQLVAVNLQTGTLSWLKALGSTKGNAFGLTNSLLAYQNSLLVVFQGEERYIARLAAKDGQEIWRTERASDTWAAPSLAPRKDGSTLVVLPAYPAVTAWDVDTGKQAWSRKVFEEEPEWCVGPSAIVLEKSVVVHMQFCGMFALNLEDGSTTWQLLELPDGSDFSDGSSAASDGHTVYHFCDAVLSCIDGQTGKVIAQRETEIYENYASVLLNAGRLYLSCEKGVTLVLDADPAKELSTIGRGVVSRKVECTPAIGYDRLYLRAEKTLYCVGLASPPPTP
ncbi:MAG TPA: hypothetical protein DCR55_07515 [Lentisphaeria bacterium]|nr:hypothetical protein [Lentisphaeria bacterium]